MIVSVNDDWRIATDSSNWIVQKRNGWYKDKKTAQRCAKWDCVSYHRNCEAALNQLFELRVRHIDSDVPNEIIRLGRAIAAEITQACRFFEKFGGEVLAEIQSEDGF